MTKHTNIDCTGVLYTIGTKHNPRFRAPRLDARAGRLYIAAGVIGTVVERMIGKGDTLGLTPSLGLSASSEQHNLLTPSHKYMHACLHVRHAYR